MVSVSERARRALKELGLSEYEIKAYIALIEFGPMIAADVSRQSGVPYSKVYDTLSSLEGKGWIEAERTRPSRFYPKPPSLALETMRMRIEGERRRNEAQVLSELLPLYERRGVKERPEIWIVRGEYNILAKVKETLLSCERELMVAVPSVVRNIAEFVAPAMEELKRKGVRVMVMTAEGGEDALRIMKSWGEVRVREQMFGGGVIADGRQAVLLLAGDGEKGSNLAIWADHEGLAKFAKDYFEFLWRSPETVPYRAGQKTSKSDLP